MKRSNVAVFQLEMFDVEQDPASEPGDSLASGLPSTTLWQPRGEPAAQADRDHLDPPPGPPGADLSFVPAAGAQAVRLNSIAASGTDGRPR